ncbi:MAG: HAD-IC family P-type ATPase, partial [Oscillospiraceae bacterium]
MKPWTLPPAAVLDELTVSAAGLSAREAAERLTQYGANRLTAHKPPSRLLRFLAQLKDPMILLLLGAAVLSLAASGGKDFLEPVIILTIVLANALISVSQEQSAQKALDALQTLASPHATCLRDGVPTVLPACQVVPGDVVLLSPGDLVPADGRLLSSVALQCDESAMTGESLPVSKHTSPLPPETPLADRRNMVLSSCIVTAGRGTLVVTATGMNTELGQIAAMLHSAEEPTTPLQKKLTEISKTLSLLCLAVCAVLFGVGLLQHQDALSLFLTAVALAVAAIPEGLPAIVTIVLALGVQRMAAQRAIVKKLPAVETLGCASVICSDKTGTLTQNKMTVTALWTVSPADEALLLTIGALCNNASLEGTPVGDPTELALLVAAKKGGIPLQTLDRDRPRLWEFPFDAQRKRMTVLCKTETGYRAYVKGAPDVLRPRGPNPAPRARGGPPPPPPRPPRPRPPPPPPAGGRPPSLLAHR